MTGLFRYLAGYKIFRFTKSDAARLMNICRECGITYTDFRFDGDECVMTLGNLGAKRLYAVCEARGIEHISKEEKGFPQFLKKHKNRCGLLVGAVAAMIFGVITSGLVWDIRVEGNTRISEGEVEHVLEECGLSVGSSHRGFDAGVIENRALILSDDISWISVNIKGTVAEVEIRETAFAEESQSMTAANLVASQGGVIEYLEDTRGKVMVDAGEAVSEGELLVSGIYGSDTEGFRYTVARGKVYARTERSFSVDIPLEYSKKEYTGGVKTEKYLIFFKKEVKFYSNCGHLYEFCDTIDTVEYFESFGDAELPFGVRTVKHLEYRYTDAQRDADSAADLAYYRLGELLNTELHGGELLSKEISFELSDKKYTLLCRVRAIENIAVVKEVEIELMPIPRK